jgi:predicted ATPase with chaperone activity
VLRLWISLAPLPSRQRSRVHPEPPGHGLLAQPEVPPDPDQPLPGSPVRVVGAVAKEFDDLRQEGEGRGDTICLPRNAQMGAREVREHCRHDEGGARLLEGAMRALGLSARGYARVLKVARTIADLAGEPKIGITHIAESIQYRMLDRQ